MSFYVTLPSNSSMNIYTQNTVSNFTTSLATPLVLEGEWVVALSKIIFQNSIESDIGGIELLSPSFQKIKLRVKNMAKFVEVIEPIGVELKKFKIDSEDSDKHVKFTPPENVTFRITGALPYILNVDPYVIYSNTQPLEIQKLDKTIQKTDTLFIYTDFIEDQFVGDTKAKLLDTVSIQGEKDETITVSLTNPNYVDVSKSLMSTINIMIKDSLGDFIHFSNLSRVIIKLHFKPKSYE